MKWPAALILAALILSAAIQITGEFANILKEKLVLNAALVNSCRAAHNNSLDIWYMMNLDAHVGEDDFIQLFSDEFAKSLDLTHNFDKSANTDNRVVFVSNAGRFNAITVSFEYSDAADSHGRPVTRVTVNLRTPYMFRTYWLSLVNGVSNDDYLLTDNREFIVQIIN